MRILLAGLWDRRGINAAALLVIWVAVTAAVLGPMYGRASSEHLVDTRLEARAPYTTGLSFSVEALDGLPDDPDAYTPPDPQSLVEESSAAVAQQDPGRTWPVETGWLLDRGGSMEYGATTFQVPLYWRDGMCALADVRGRCPAAAGEVLVQRVMAETLGVGPGDTLELGYVDRFLEEVADGSTIERERGRQRTFDVVGTYDVADPDSPEWFDLSRFTGIENLIPPPPKGESAPPAAPSLLVAPASMDSQTFRGGVDRPVDPGAVDLATMDRVEAAALRYQDRLIELSSGGEVEQLELSTLFDEIRAERSLLQRVMVAALAPLVALSLLLLYALAAAGSALRRPHVALAKLRGHSGRQVFGFAVGEPFLVVALAVPLALGSAVLLAHLIARVWLTSGIPVLVDGIAWTALAAVAASALLASALAALDVIREPLSRALASALSTKGTSRAALVLRSAVVAVAVAAVAQLLTSADQSSQLLALLAPLLIALAVAVGGAWLLKAASARWLQRTTFARGTPAYLASRRLARRSDLANLMIPLLLAVSVITFAVSASAVSDDWRVSRARAEVGAARTFVSEVSVGRLLNVTREVDPEGRYLAAAAVENAGDDMNRRLLVDSTRLSTVVAWDPAWSEESLSTLQRELRPPADRMTFRGDELSVTTTDVSLESSSGEISVLWVQYVNDDGEQRNAELGVLRDGSGPRTLTGAVRECDDSCTVEQLFITGEGQSVLDVDGRLTLSGVAVDGEPVDWRLGEPEAWRAARPFPVSLVDPPVELLPRRDGLRLNLYLGQLPPGVDDEPTMVAGVARITPADVPDVVPVVVAEGTAADPARQAGAGTAIEYDRSTIRAAGLNGGLVPARVVAEVHALPGLGDEGAMADLETSLVEFEPPFGAAVLPQLWVADGTPQSVLDEVEAAGVPLTPIGDLERTLDGLRGDAFSLGLRLFLVVGLATLLLAVFGVFASAVLQSRWRSYEVASLRVVGISPRTLLRASVLEYVVMLGLAVLLGLGSAYLALRLVLPALSLGTAAEHEPSPLYATHLPVLLGVGGALFAVATLIALLVSRRIVRLGRPATLRWADQG
ncbi:MAG TPA: FtsX-like permease family protein [Nocardioides sp.]|uniref:FtsX-like permease family protein n=1 Tax=Nocardioides sp. TaxID=35761 RepID=UPI002D800601|nr:FtsX-like permease family protein [Nocardioides sp.]HET6653859.1 FtsX-like permease family protein [Nocardioides sp.]